ncbi:MAG: efflux transporter outer membrane subunit [Pseudomonadota bacterium]
MIRQLSIAAAMVILSSCTVIGPTYNAPETEALPRFVESADYQETTPQPVWWEAFDDPILNRLVARALAENNRIGVAVSNVNVARASYGLARLERVPFDTISASYLQSRSSGAAIGAAFVIPGQEGNTDSVTLPTEEILNASVAASWEVDLFGRVTRSIRAAEADLEQTSALLIDLRSVVAAETVDAYVTYRGLTIQTIVARENILNQKETVRLVTIRRDAGRGSDLDVERAKEQLATTIAVLPPLESQAKASLYRLATLTGQRPEEIKILAVTAGTPPTIEGDLPIGNPEAMLRRRPDVRAAERALAASTERIGLQMASAFPTITLTGSVGVQTLGIDDAFANEALNFNLGPSISWSLTNLLRARRNVLAANASAEGAFDNYEQTVLLALEETESALIGQRAVRASLMARESAEASSSKAAELARFRYERGASDFLDVLDAERRNLEARNSLAAARTDLARSQVAVFRALRADAPLIDLKQSPGQLVASQSPEGDQEFAQ